MIDAQTLNLAGLKEPCYKEPWRKEPACRHYRSVDATDRILVQIGERVRLARVAANLTQMDAAHAAGRDVRWWQRMEHGRVNPTARTFARVADALHVTLCDLFCGGAREAPARKHAKR